LQRSEITEAMARDQLQFRLTIDSRFENIELVQVVLNDTLERLGLEDDTRHWVDLATREAVANAIKHGNREAADKHVEIEMAVAGDEVVLRIADQGGGFDPGIVGDPLSPENLLRPSGRGLFYMQSFMDRVSYEPRSGGGTVVTLHKRVFGSTQDTGAGSREAAKDATSGGE
jgi:serine/threonine-protein kinase RsbW